MKAEKLAVIVHRWDGKPQADWYPWLKKELEKKSYRVLVPKMPNPSEPNMHEWVSALNETISNPNSETILIGHSIGCQTILRWGSMLPKIKKIGKVILVAPWMTLQGVEKDKESQRIAQPWSETPIAWEMILQHCKKFTCIFSDNDPFVKLSEVKLFEKKLHAKIIIQKHKGHFTKDDGMKEFPEILDWIKE